MREVEYGFPLGFSNVCQVEHQRRDIICELSGDGSKAKVRSRDAVKLKQRWDLSQ